MPLRAKRNSKRPVDNLLERLGCILLLLLLSISRTYAIDPEKEHPITLRAGLYENYPKIYRNAQGKADGFFPAILDYVALQEGWNIQYVHGSWQECLDRLSRGEIDLMPDVAITPERQALYTFNEEMALISWAVIYSRPELPILSFLDLKDKRIALMRGSVYNHGKDSIRHILDQFAIPAQFLEYNSYRDVLLALDQNQADAGVVNNIFGAYFEKDHRVVRSPVLFSPSQLHFAFARGSSAATNIAPRIDRHLRNLKNKPDSFYYRAMEAHLFGTPHQPEKDTNFEEALTLKEKNWLQQHPNIRIAYDPEFYPFEFRDENNTYQGIAADYVNILNQVFGIPLRVEQQLDWTSAVFAIQRREVDVFPCVGITKERSEYLLFSDPYITYQRVILTRADMPFITGISDLNSLRVGVQQKTSHEGFLEENSTIQPIRYASLESALMALSGGKIDAVVANLSSSAYWIRKLNLINLKIAAPASAEVCTLHFAVRKDWPELISIINKALIRIPLEQCREIERRWVAVEYKTGVDKRTIWRIGVRVASMIMLIVSALSIWTWRLKKEVALRREAEAELARHTGELEAMNRKLQELDRLKNMFIASVSHELRTPLNSIIGFTGVILRGMAGPINDKQSDQLNRVYHSAHHLLDLITDIIDISKIEAGSVEVFAERFFLDEMIREAVDSIRPQAQLKALVLEQEIPIQIEVFTDRKRLRQCVLNILSNAVKYSESGTIRIQLNVQNNHYEIKISDTGIGISAEDQQRLFMPFVRLDSHLRVKAGGTGLGLYLTRKITHDILQGTLSVSSEPGRGSTFIISAPMHISSGTIEQKGVSPA